MKHIILLTLAVSCVMMYPSSAMASSDVLDFVCGQMLIFWEWLRTAIYVLSACGLALISFQASVVGKFSMGNFISIGGGLFIVAMAAPIIAYLTSGSASLACP